MSNFAQECPILIFLPFYILAAVAVITGFTQLAVSISAKVKSHRITLDRAETGLVAAPSRQNLAALFNLGSAGPMEQAAQPAGRVPAEV